ncbi:kinesin 2 [Collybia nuda]|uniref:Kinesin 2 n=1 Tax=Collybia nuda TaxID=64659 RepID=A0A9P6CLB1_9AGAR|nr:kinesin 2 [Collybia nuda]
MKHNRSPSQQEDSEINIQVVIRCRGRSEREIQDNSPNIVSSTGARSKEVSIEASNPISSLGLVSLPPLRTYPFDLVFGPEADQAMIYHDVVSPMLDEVLMGYNCTLFAYGQTGTGKTYTMQGDLNPTSMGNPSTKAGMIPRVLFRLFHYLETSKTDYSVKISYIELYNEELRDLLTNDLSAPNGSTQPMGMAKDSNKNPENGLKIFDDASKRGVTIQGLEEVAVKDSKDALALLTKGSQRRQIAATKFNDHSSRSHSIFSITVHIKEMSAIGEDLLKTGKLNLVDLAGSENIGRSGAENKRAREAGMINQSLLTLGRVINALVDKAQHIPYRESKLTRLLQDSLGGRTKTCIIATISPARSNMEETLSTLDYAIRAKSIRNKPELNQRTTRNSLLKEYVGEIERLKSDLLAAREKNGIFFSEETWNQMTMEQELRVTELDEAKKQVGIIETEMRAVRDEFEQSIGLLKIREGELKETREKLFVTEKSLGKTENELTIVKDALEEETVMRKAYQNTEKNLNDVATGLKRATIQGVQDVGDLLEKLERKSAILDANSQALLSYERTISLTRHLIEQKLDAFLKASSQSTRKLQSEVKMFQTKEIEALASCSARTEVQIQHVGEALDIIKSTSATETEALEVIQTTLQETHETFKSGFGTWGEGLKKSYDGMNKHMKEIGLEAFSTVETALTTMTLLVETLVSEHQEYIDTELKRLLEVKALAHETSENEIRHLKQQNESLIKLLDSERTKADKTKDQLIQQVSALLGDFTKERDKDLRAAIAIIQSENRKAEEEMKIFSDQHHITIGNMEIKGAEMSASLKTKRGEGKRTRDGAYKVLNKSSAAFISRLDGTQSMVSSSVGSYSKQVQDQVEMMTTSCSNAFERHRKAKRARIDATTAMGTDVQSEYHSMQRGITSTSRNIENFAGRVSKEALELEGATNTYQNATSSQLGSISGALEGLVAEGTREDIPTGTTPRKRVWEYVDQWELTQSREAVLQTWKEQGASKVGPGTLPAEHISLPEESDDLGDDTITTFPLRNSFSTELENVPSGVSSPDALSPHSSTSVSLDVVPMPRLPLKKAPGHRKGIPSLGTLTDSRNIYTTRGSRRAR